MSTPILTKTTSAGEAIVRMSSSMVKTLEVEIAGKVIGSGWVQKLREPKGEITHYVVKLGLTTAEAEAIEAAFRAACAPSLRDQRSALSLKLQGLRDDQTAAFERGHASDGSAAYAAAQAFDGRIAEAERALEAFDAEHPEVMAEIRAEKAERAARNTWM